MDGPLDFAASARTIDILVILIVELYWYTRILHSYPCLLHASAVRARAIGIHTHVIDTQARRRLDDSGSSRYKSST